MFKVAVKSKPKKPASKTKENADPNKQKSPKATKTKAKDSKNEEPGIVLVDSFWVVIVWVKHAGNGGTRREICSEWEF